MEGSGLLSMEIKFATLGLECLGNRWENVELQAGEAGGWQVADEFEAKALLDTLLGFRRPDAGEVQLLNQTRSIPQRIEGRESLPQTEFEIANRGPRRRILQSLRGVGCLTAGEGLLANLTLGENVMLPAWNCWPHRARELEQKLESLVTVSGGRFGHDARTLSALPHTVDEVLQASAELLRLEILEPEVVLVCLFFSHGWRGKRERLLQWLLKLKAKLSKAAWVFLEMVEELPNELGVRQYHRKRQ